MIYPNGQRVFAYPGRHLAGLLAASGALAYGGLRGARLNRYASGVQAKTAGIPDGYNAPALPLKPGGMAAAPKAIATVSGAGSMLSASVMSGSASITLAGNAGSMGLVVSMAGNAVLVSLTAGAGVMNLTLGMAGSGGVASVSGAGNMSLVVPFAGTGTVVQLTGTGNLKGIATMQGEWTPYAELSPQSLANAVWGALATQNNEAGSMGAKLNTASSGGVDLTALAEAVRLELSAELDRITKVAKLHGVGVSLVVTPTTRTAGDLVQTISTEGDTVTVSQA